MWAVLQLQRPTLLIRSPPLPPPMMPIISSNSISISSSSSSLTLTLTLLPFPFRRRRRHQLFPCFSTPSPVSSSCFSRRFRPFLRTAAGTDFAAASLAEDEDEEDEEDFVEVGYVSKVHGLQGELRVVPTTDFPQLRFSQPGKRWLRARVSGKEVISEVELIAGRDHPGQKSWIISLRGINTVDQAMQIVGSTLLVKEGDRPELGEDEFYTRDLVGMRVILKETGRLIGVVANVFNYGASDLLQVTLNSETTDYSNSSNRDTYSSGQMVLVPFVEAIVPEVDMDKREMCITPPKGLLELNLRNDIRSKKERRQLEWKERKKLQHRFTSAKRKLSEMRQNHLLELLKLGEKAQRTLLIRQIVNINFKLFQHAVHSIRMPLDGFNLSGFIHANSAILQKNAFKISSESLSCCACKEKGLSSELHREGLQLLMKSKAAIVVILNDEMNIGKDLETEASHICTPETKLLNFQELILDYKGLLEVAGQGISVPLILVLPADEIRSYEELVSNCDFGLDNQKVWFLEEEKLPIVSLSSDSLKVLTKSSCEILEAPTGSGGVFSLLSSHSITDKLIQMGVEYVQICGLGGRSKSDTSESLLLLGLVKSRGADMGISMLQGEIEENDEFNMVFSMMHLNKLCKQIDKLDFSLVPEQHAHVGVVKVEEDYVEQIHPIPDKPNSHRLHSSIYSALNTCSLDRICIMYVTSDE